ncbi:MAG: NAD(+)/NADH kinase [Eubacteriales bacterium]
MNRKVHTLVLVTNTMKDPDLSVYRQILDYTLSLGFEVRVPAELPAQGAQAFSDPDALYCGADCAVLLGGDGTILNAARFAVPAGCPMLGINLGRMGYMAELEVHEYRLLSRLRDGDYGIEQRMTLSVETESGGIRRTVYGNALNDAVITNGVDTHVIDLLLRCDGAEVLSYRGNGLILSSPTGSTGYAMSAGGPVVDPSMDCMTVVPICSVSPAAKPLVFSADSEMTIENRYERLPWVLLTVDGREACELPVGARVVCRRAPQTAKMIRLKDNKFFSVLRAKIT